ncbi:hypothetical protein LCGC14_0476010 [marine sediment metagenome]|uniref:Uncharacterized protein n=1 Tax=marine sediment metagenome TaxID=412755 RepID=A0A0F9SG29_9ZZZZ
MSLRSFAEDTWSDIEIWCLRHLNPKYLQIVGYVTSVAAYGLLLVLHFVFGMSLVKMIQTPWLGEGIWFTEAILAGIPELILIFVFHITITKFGRGLLKKSLDAILMIGCIPLTWWAFGPIAAVIHFTGAILFHYGEKQPK